MQPNTLNPNNPAAERRDRAESGSEREKGRERDERSGESFVKFPAGGKMSALG